MFPRMNPKTVLLVYATREGHTSNIARRLARSFESHGFQAEYVDARDLPADFSLSGFTAAILAASVHLGKHEPEMAAFATRHAYRRAAGTSPTVLASESARRPKPFDAATLDNAARERRVCESGNDSRDSH